MKVIAVFLLFCAAQVISLFLALGFSGPMVWEQLVAGQMPALMPESFGISLLVCEGLLSLLVWTWLRKQTALSPSSLLTGSMHLRQLSVIIGVPVLSLGLSFLLTPFDVDDGGMGEIFNQMMHNPLCLLLLCVVGPLTEELVFRSGMVRLMRLYGLSALMAVTVSAFSFAAVHGNLVQGIPAFLIGILLGYLYLRTGNLKLCLPAHIANNTVAALLVLIPGADTMTDGMSTYLLVLLGLLYMALGLAFCWRALK